MRIEEGEEELLKEPVRSPESKAGFMLRKVEVKCFSSFPKLDGANSSRV